MAEKGAKYNPTQTECGDCGTACAINNREMTRYKRAARGAHPVMLLTMISPPTNTNTNTKLLPVTIRVTF